MTYKYFIQKHSLAKNSYKLSNKKFHTKHSILSGSHYCSYSQRFRKLFPPHIQIKKTTVYIQLIYSAYKRFDQLFIQTNQINRRDNSDKNYTLTKNFADYSLLGNQHLEPINPRHLRRRPTKETAANMVLAPLHIEIGR